MYGQDVCSEVRQRASIEVLEMAKDLAVFAEDVMSRAGSMLTGVMSEQRNKVEAAEAAPIRAFPPLFNELRNQLFSIRESVGMISSFLDRTEL